MTAVALLIYGERLIGTVTLKTAEQTQITAIAASLKPFRLADLKNMGR